MKEINKPITVIATYDTDGVITPVRIKIRDENNELIVWDIKNVLYSEKRRRPVFEYLFRCRAIVNGVVKVFDLKFDCMSCKWVLHKI